MVMKWFHNFIYLFFFVKFVRMLNLREIKVLTFASYYLPGFKGGGPIRTMASLVEALGDALDFFLVTMDRDLGSSEPYPGVHVNSWQQVGKAKVFYLSPDKLTWSFLRELVCETPHDILYLNSFFSPYFSILPMFLRRFGLIPQKPVVLGPRGEFSPGALRLKATKKNAYIRLAKTLRLYDEVTWQASSSHELEDIQRIFGGGRSADTKPNIVVAPDLPDIKPLPERPVRSKDPGTLRIVFLSRLSPKKNLDGALKLLARVNGKVLFDIYGPLEDTSYWDQCQGLIEQLPDTVQVRYQGMIAHDTVVPTMANYDLFFLPTLGENYGHVIIESLAAGCPVLISDQTPWRNLEVAGVGWDIPLDQPERFTAALQRCVDMSSEELAGYSARARAYAERTMTDSVAVQQNRDLFLQLL